MSEIEIVVSDGSRETRPVLHTSPRGTFVVADLRGSSTKGTVDVFHVGTGKRATPKRHFDHVRNRTVAKALADWLDEQEFVNDDGSLRVDRAEYHRAFDEWVKGD